MIALEWDKFNDPGSQSIGKALVSMSHANSNIS